MTTTHIRHLAVVTLDEAGTILNDADLIVIDGRIAHLGEAPQGLRADEVVDGSGRVAMPGLVNSHCHSPMTFERGWAEDLPFDRWLNEKIWVGRERADPRRRVLGRGAGGVRDDPLGHGGLRRQVLPHGPRGRSGSRERHEGGAHLDRVRHRRSGRGRAESGGDDRLDPGDARERRRPHPHLPRPAFALHLPAGVSREGRPVMRTTWVRASICTWRSPRRRCSSRSNGTACGRCSMSNRLGVFDAPGGLRGGALPGDR